MQAAEPVNVVYKKEEKWKAKVKRATVTLRCFFLEKDTGTSCCSSIFSATIHNPPRTLFFALGKRKKEKAENYLSLMATGMNSHLDGKLKQVPKALHK